MHVFADRKNITDVELFNAMDLERAGLGEVRVAADAGDFGEAYRAWGRYLAARKDPKWYVDIETYGEGMQRAFPRIAEEIVRRADRIVAHDVVHGNFTLNYKDGIPDYRVDPHGTISGFSVHNMYVLEPLGRAYLITDDARYAESYRVHLGALYDQRREIPRWKDECDLFWTSELNTGLRLIHMTDAYLCVRGYAGLTTRDHEAALKLILAFSEFELDLARNGNHHPSPNWRMTGAGSLGLSGAQFPEFRNAEAKKSRGISNVMTFLADGVYPDGAAMELCTQYHLTMIREPAKLARTLMLNGERFLYSGGEHVDLFRNMHDWIAHLVAPDGFTPPHHSGVYCTEWLPYLLLYEHFNPGAGYADLIDRFYGPDFVPVGKQRPGDTLYLLTPDIVPQPAAGRSDSRDDSPETCTAVHLQPSGTCVMRVGNGGETAYLSTVYGKPVEGHGYPQLGSFVLHTADRWRALHPGSPFSYDDPDYRTYFHTTFSHNTVVVDDTSQSFFDGDPEHPEIGASCTAWADDSRATILRITHEGYLKPTGIMHTRTFVMLDCGWLFIHDRLWPACDDNAEHSFSWSFHTGMDLEDDGALHGPDFALVPAYSQEITTTSAVKPCMLPTRFEEGLENQLGTVNQYTFAKKGRRITYGVMLATLAPGQEPPTVTALSPPADRDQFETFRISAQDTDYVVMLRNDLALDRELRLAKPDLVTKNPVLVAAIRNGAPVWRVEASAENQ